MSLLLVELGSETAQVLGILRSLVAFTGSTLSNSFFMIEAAAVQLTPPFHILVLRLQGVSNWSIFNFNSMHTILSVSPRQGLLS